MKVIVNIARILVGGLFIFSGLVKAIDPLGLSYKMQEFFEVWANDGFMPGLMMSLHKYALVFSVCMITLEVVLGFALLIGWQKKITIWVILLLTLFFTFLTAFVLFTGKIRACGCFGDCIPLTPMQTFTKDIILTALIVLILTGKKYINPLFKQSISIVLMVLILAGVLLLQWYALKHLPIKDCLPFKIGNNIIELRKMPKDAVPDKYEYVFTYQKNGEKKDFTANNLPDSTWQFVDRKQKLIQKGKNNIPLINDFSLTTQSGNDTTDAILSQPGAYFLLFIKNADAYSKNGNADLMFIQKAIDQNKTVYIISSQIDKVKQRYSAYSTIPVFSCDATAIKTAARNNITLYLMNGPVVQNKWGGNDIKKALVINN